MSVGDENQPSLTRLLCDVVFHSRRYVVPTDEVAWRHSKQSSTWLNLSVLQPSTKSACSLVMRKHSRLLLLLLLLLLAYYFVM